MLHNFFQRKIQLIYLIFIVILVLSCATQNTSQSSLSTPPNGTNTVLVTISPTLSATATATLTPTIPPTTTATTSLPPTTTYTPSLTPAPTITNTTPITLTAPFLKEQGYQLLHRTSVFSRGNAIYHAELYHHPKQTSNQYLDKLLILKTENEQTVQIDYVESMTLSFNIAWSGLITGTWQPLNKSLVKDNYPYLAVCVNQCQPNNEQVYFFVITDDDRLTSLAPFFSFTNWSTATWQQEGYGLVLYTVSNQYPEWAVYKVEQGQPIFLMKKGDLSTDIDDSGLQYKIEEFTVNGEVVADINDDGLIEFVLQRYTRVCLSYILQIQADDKVAVLDGPSCIEEMIDLNEDGVAELISPRYFESSLKDNIDYYPPQTNIVYTWQEGAYVEANFNDFAEYYIEQVLMEAQNIATGSHQLRYFSDVYRLEEIMQVYKRLDRTEEGLLIFDKFTNPVCYNERLNEEATETLRQLRELYNLPPRSNAPCQF